MKKKTITTILELVRIIAAFLAGVIGGNNAGDVLSMLDIIGNLV